MNYLNDPLWQRISSFTLDDPESQFPFSRKLAKENNWSHSFAVNAIEEYKKFVYLCCISPQGASPSKIIDEVWHLHLTYTISYWKVFCDKVLQRELHHHPSKGGEQETKKYDQLYIDTMALYESTFDKAAPVLYWNPAQKINPVMALNGLSLNEMYIPFLVYILPFILIELLYHKINPFYLTGPQFLFFMLSLICCTAIHFIICYFEQQKIRRQFLENNTTGKDAYELAYLSKGKRAYQQIVLIDLIEQQKIELIDKSFYTIHRENMMNTWNPLNHFLKEFHADTIELNEIMSEAFWKTNELDVKYPELDTERSIPWQYYIPVGVIVMIGILRIFQGIGNDKPVSFLVMMMLCFFFLSKSAIDWIQKSVRNNDEVFFNEENMSHISSEAQRTFLLSGTSALIMLPLFYHLHDQPYFTRDPNKSNNWSGSDSGGGCGSGGDGCSGGSCGGGGCGGCGGGD